MARLVGTIEDGLWTPRCVVAKGDKHYHLISTHSDNLIAVCGAEAIPLYRLWEREPLKEMPYCPRCIEIEGSHK